jgi:hypothetical protein
MMLSMEKGDGLDDDDVAVDVGSSGDVTQGGVRGERAG